MRGNGRLISGALASAGVCSALALAGVTAGTVPARAEPAAAPAASGAAPSTTSYPVAGAGGATGRAVSRDAGHDTGRSTGYSTGYSTGHSTGGGAGAGQRASSTVPVIVFLRNQWAGAGTQIRSEERGALIQAAQAPVLGQLRALGATGVTGYRLADAIAARVPAAALGAISATPGVASVIPDSPIKGPDPAAAPEGAAGAGGGAASARAASPPAGRGAQAPVQAPQAPVQAPAGACSATPQLEPEGLALTRTDSTAKGAVTARSLGFTGAGVKVAFLADGIDPGNANLVRHGKPVIGVYQDFSGDAAFAPTAGGEAFADANAIAGQGSQAYNVAGFGTQGPAGRCQVRIEGSAPGASLVALKVFSNSDISTTSGFLQAIDYAVNVRHVNVLSESFGANPFPDVTSLDAVKQFNDMAVRAGTTVVVASGDAGPFNTIGSPASDPAVISVGASTGFRFYAQTNYAGADQFAPRGWESDNISSLSSSGYTEDGRTLDLVAPGDMSFASCTPVMARYSSCVNFLGKPSPVEQSGGTSQSAPLVAGAAALVIQAYAKAHHGAAPAPAAVKQILLSSATDLGAPATEQGAGLLNSARAVELAAARPASAGQTTAGPNCDRAGPALRLSASQLNYAGAPGAATSWPVTVTNSGCTGQTVTVSGRGFGAAAVIRQATVTLSDTKSPHFTNWAGTASNFATVRFSVPRGAALLNASIAWPASAAGTGHPNARVRVILVDPAGRLAAHSLPQGVGGYGSVQVLRPAAGGWTAVIFGDTAKAGGPAGPVRFGASVAHAVAFGGMSPSRIVLRPGQAAVVRVSARVPAGAGDSSGSVVFTPSGAAGPASSAGAAGGDPVSVPVTLRGLVPTGPGENGKFSGVLTGGNGRAPGEGQVAAYSFSVPSDLPVLLRNIDVDVTLANDPVNQVSGYLVAPGGETMGYGSNYLTTGFNGSGVPVESPKRQLSLYASNPVPGVWTLIIDFTAPVPGNELADPFSGRIRFNAVSFDRGQLPDSPSVTLPRGVPVTYQIAVRNTGAAPEDVFLDPRLTTLQSYPLQPQDQAAGVRLPVPATANPPEWIVPTMTHSVSATVTSSSAPVMFDFEPFPGDPDEVSSTGRTATATYPLGPAVTPVTQGLWFTVPAEVGPYPAAGAPRTTVNAAMSAVTQQFDTSATPSTGDFWRFAVAPLAETATYNLFPVNPGQTRTITLTVKPSAPAGTVVRGMLYIDDFVDSLQFLSGSQLVAVPYSYTVG